MKSETLSKHQAPRILVIDDEPDVLMIMAKRLMDAGFEVITADGG